MASRYTVAQAKASCHRCHRRKKKCDRSLPQCGNCEQADVDCSFLEENNEFGSYPIACVTACSSVNVAYASSFVNGLQDQICELENKIQELERQLSEHEDTQLHFDRVLDPGYSDVDMQVESTPLDIHTTSIGLSDCAPVEPCQRSQSKERHGSMVLPTPLTSLDQQLKEVTLQAAAERHLGNSSGVNFARLTQMVLSRLSPDRADFVFEVPPPSAQECSQPLALNSILDEFSTFDPFCPTAMFTGILLSDITEPADALTNLRLPEEPRLTNLVDFYFAHSHTLYPIIDQVEFTTSLASFRHGSDDVYATSPLSAFRIWIVLAIGATTYCSVTLNEESEAMTYFNKAMLYFEASLEYGEMVTLEVLMLQVSYSFFNQLGPNTWFLVGLATRVAVGMGLHSSSAYDDIPPHAIERKKQLFFSVYMMDRVVSMALGRPSAIHDEDIEITPFSAVSDNTNSVNESLHQSSFQPSTLAIPLHILALRKIASKIARNVYCSNLTTTRTPGERIVIIKDLHKELLDWRRNMPFPLPDEHPQVPQMSTTWYDFNFYTHLTLLYRPSPLFPTLNEERLRVLADAASMSIRQALNMHRQQRFAYNWLNLLSLFTVAVSLVYATTASPESLTVVLKRSKAIQDLEAATGMFQVMAIKYPAANKIGGMIEQIVVRYKDICNAA